MKRFVNNATNSGNLLDINKNIIKNGTNSSNNGIKLENINTKLEDSKSSKNSFNDRKVVNVINQFDIKSIFGLSALRDNVVETGDSSVVNNFGGAEYELTASGGLAQLTTVERGRYTAGSSLEIGMGVRIGTINNQSTVIKYGYFDDDDGIYFVVKWNASENKHDLYLEIKRKGVITHTIPRANFFDKLDGLGPSKATLDFSVGNIWRIDFTWYGYGQINFSYITNVGTDRQKPILLYSITPSDTTSINNPNLPLRASVNSSSVDNIYIAGRQCSVIGSSSPTYRLNGVYRTGISVEQSQTPLMTLRRKTGFQGAETQIYEVDIISSGDIELEFRSGSTLDTVSFEQLSSNPDEETTVEKSITGTTVSGGIPIYKTILPSGKNTVVTSKFSYNLNEFETITITAVRYDTGGATVDICVRIKEGW